MGIKQSILTNMGMRRDLDVSREDGKHAYENFNVRITASDGETQLAVTNARGNVRLLPRLVTHGVSDGGGWTDFVVTEEELVIEGLLVGYGVLNNYLVLFTHSDREGDATPDRIYRVEYRPGADPEWVGMLLLESDYGFSAEAPIETLCDFESEDVQKVYWTDGLNQPRVINISDKYVEEFGFSARTKIDFVSEFGGGLEVEITKKFNENSALPGGCIQYVFTYANKFGQESNIVYVSQMCYSTMSDRACGPEETSTSSFVIKVTSCDTEWQYVRIYRIMQTSESGVYTAYLIATLETASMREVTDNGANVETVDASALMYVGGREISAYTMCAKDGVLFLGGIRLKGFHVDEKLEGMFSEYRGERVGMPDGISALLSFKLTDDAGHSIPYGETDGYYPYEMQLNYMSDRIRTFKAGEKYRIGIRFMTATGMYSSVYWVGDVEQTLYPRFVISEGYVSKAYLECSLPSVIVGRASELGFVRAELMMAEMSVYDRAVAAQGIVAPTVFRLEQRVNGEVHSYSSWYARPRGTGMANRHFECLPRNDSRFGEIQCNSKTATAWLDSLYEFDESFGKAVEITAKGEIVRYKVVARIYYLKYDDGGNVVETDSTLREEYTEYSSSRSNIRKKVVDWLNLHGFSQYAARYVNEKDSKGDYVFENWLTEVSPLAQTVFSTGEINTSIVTHTYHYDTHLWRELTGASYKRRKERDMLDFDTMYMYFGININGISNDNFKRYASIYRNNFFVDESVCTFHSPEIDSESVADFNGVKYGFRIIGIARLSSNITDYEMEVSNRFSSESGKIDYNLCCTSDKDALLPGLVSFPLYYSMPINSVKGDDKELVKVGSPTNSSMYVYPFHKSESISNRYDGDVDDSGLLVAYYGDACDVLDTKTESNMRFCLYNTYGFGELLKPWTPPNGIHPVRIFSSTEDVPVLFETESGSVIYNGNYDFVLTSRFKNTLSGDDWTKDTYNMYDDGYHIYDTGSMGAESDVEGIIGWYEPTQYGDGGSDDDDGDENPKQDEDTTIDVPVPDDERYNITTSRNYAFTDKRCLCYDPVQVSVKSTPHAVISFRTEETGDESRIVFLPNTYHDESFSEVIDEIHEPEKSVDDEGNVIDEGQVFMLPWMKYETLERFDGMLYVDLLSPSELFPLSGQTDGIYWRADISSYETEGVIVLRGCVREEYEAFLKTYFDAEGKALTFDVPKVLLWIDDVLNVHYGMPYSVSSSPSDETDPDGNVDVWVVVVQASESFDGIYFKSGSAYRYIDNGSDTLKEATVESFRYSDACRVCLGDDVDYPYYFIAELYTERDAGSDSRYGGVSDDAVRSNVFIPLGNATYLSDAVDAGGVALLKAYSGDTYFQRWDCQKTCKYSGSAVNNINDFVSFMVETRKNIEGRCDVYRGFLKLDACDTENFNVYNTAYDNLGELFDGTMLDEKFSLSNFTNQVTWTLNKQAAADIDNWTNVTLASTLDMDGSKGPVRALRMVNNSIICFQDRAVSQVAFNERAQVSTESGVPVELANSGRVDGKRIISDSNGCSNKWSIAQTSGGLYYVDDVRRSLVRFGERMDDLSTSKGLSVWVRGLTALTPWEPGAGRNFRTFYDRTLHDVYFSRGAAEDGLDTLCFSETLDEFMTFHSWGAVTMLESVGDRLVAADTEGGDTRLWLQGEGPHDLHFGEYQDFHVTFRAAPEPLADKTFTNLEYRADMFDCADGDALTGETFQRVDVWDEHQTGGAELTFDSYRDRYPDVRRRFRVWRADIPRDAKGENNPFGLNRMRNPWLFLKLTRRASEYGAGTDLRMVMHDLLITYFE